MDEIEYEVWAAEVCVALVCGASEEEAQAEAMHYAQQYAEDEGTARVYRVTKTRELFAELAVAVLS